MYEIDMNKDKFRMINARKLITNHTSVTKSGKDKVRLYWESQEDLD